MKHIYLAALFLISISACQESASRQTEQYSQKVDTLFLPKASLAKLDLLKNLEDAFDERIHRIVRPPQPPPPSEQYEDSLDCSLQGVPSQSLRSQHYPFNQAKSVKLLSYKTLSYLDTAVRDRSYYLLAYQGKLNLKEIKQTITLQEGQIDSLAHILYNFQYKGAPLYHSSSLCGFYPRNAIVFYNVKQQPFAYMEICFNCDEFLAFPKRFETGEFCNQKYELLKPFFDKSASATG